MKKNIIKVLALVLVAASLCTVFAACGKKLSGKYTYTAAEVAGIKSTVSMTFDGDKVKISADAAGKELYAIEGEYSIDGEEITFTFSGDSEAEKQMAGTVKFKEGKTDDGKAYIEIENIKYVKE